MGLFRLSISGAVPLLCFNTTKLGFSQGMVDVFFAYSCMLHALLV